ncbi:MAG: glycosyltransferase family 2 protein [Desulfobulbaceae bacterium]|nr:glycosyltransferase family 2 protein [Desulfobulbaceae bacterium]HIJ91452.1 glycosyltransferase family 2 protein [Deltaproteobacteria bacterium]
MDISIVIVNWNTRELLLDCLASVYATLKDLSFEVFLVDNASSDGSVEAVRAHYPQVRVIRNERNLGFAAANNMALRVMQGKYALLLNTDAVLTEGAVKRLVAFMGENQQVGMACGQLLNADGSKQNSIANFPTLLNLLVNETLLRILMPKRFPSKRRDYAAPIQVESCIGACLMVRKAALDMVGLLDERYFFFMEETDWALSMHQAGWQSWFVPDAHIYHLQGKSAGDNVEARKMFYRSRYQYFRKWHGDLVYLFGLMVLVRLLVNVVLNSAGVLLTLGADQGCRRRLRRYAILFGWHFRGCS